MSDSNTPISSEHLRNVEHVERLTGDEEATLAWIRQNLRDGKFLILPPFLYKPAIAFMREKGFSDEEIGQVHENKTLPAIFSAC
jgi:hypothetical protein